MLGKSHNNTRNDSAHTVMSEEVGRNKFLNGISINNMTEFRQPLQVQSHLEMPGILVQLGHIQCT